MFRQVLTAGGRVEVERGERDTVEDDRCDWRHDKVLVGSRMDGGAET